MSSPFPTIWSLIDRFKERCLLNGWETCESEDWVKTADGKYHNFLWTQTIHPSTFKRIVSNHKCGIRRNTSYEVVDVAYTCWLFPERPPEILVSQVKENPELKKRTAIFDLSYAYTGENVCRKLNETDSCVFEEFEQFLEERWELAFKPANELAALTT